MVVEFEIYSFVLGIEVGVIIGMFIGVNKIYRLMKKGRIEDKHGTYTFTKKDKDKAFKGEGVI